MIEFDEVFDGQGNLVSRTQRTVTEAELTERKRQQMAQLLSVDEYNAVRQQMQVLRDLRQMGRNAFMQLSATERDRLLYDSTVAVTQVLLSLLRDP